MNKTTPLPDLAAYMMLMKRDIMFSINCHALATVQTFDKDKQKAVVALNYKRSFNGQTDEYPVLVGCPVIVLGGGSGHLTFPIQAGDACLVLFNDVDMDNWIGKGTQGTQPSSNASHAFSDAIVLVGIHSFATPISNYDGDKVRLYLGTTELSLSNTIKLANQVTDLKTIVNGLIDLISAITVICAAPGNASSVPVNAAALTLYKTQVGSLLT